MKSCPLASPISEDRNHAKITMEVAREAELATAERHLLELVAHNTTELIVYSRLAAICQPTGRLEEAP
jgi:hypothetical protein